MESRAEPRGGAEKAGAGPKERREGARLLMGVGQGRKRSARAAGRTMFVGYEDPEVERRRQLTNFINEELDVIDEGLWSGHSAIASHRLASLAWTIVSWFYYCLAFLKPISMQLAHVHSLYGCCGVF